MSPPSRLLIVDDEASMLDFLSLLFQGEGYEVTTARSVEEARRTLERGSLDLVLCDILMPDGNGLDLLKEIKATDGSPPVIMMTAYTSTKSAIEAMKLGAADYVSKPFDVDELKIVAQKALERAELAEENVYLRRELEKKYTFNNIIGKSSRMQAIFSLIDRIARTSSTVLIHGESGTGIGMAIVYRIVQDHGGRLRVDSRPGAGTTITVELPAGGASLTLVSAEAPL